MFFLKLKNKNNHSKKTSRRNNVLHIEAYDPKYFHMHDNIVEALFYTQHFNQKSLHLLEILSGDQEVSGSNFALPTKFVGLASH